MLATLSSDHKLGLGLVAGTFILFAVASAFLIPRYRPQYPGRDGMPLFIVVAGALFVGMLFAVEFFGREPKEASAAKEGHAVPVTEVDYRIELADRNLSAGAYTFELQNKGKQPHNLTISGPGVNRAATPTIPAGSSSKLTVTLKRGRYEFYCSVPGHKQLGMDLKLHVS